MRSITIPIWGRSMDLREGTTCRTSTTPAHLIRVDPTTPKAHPMHPDTVPDRVRDPIRADQALAGLIKSPRCLLVTITITTPVVRLGLTMRTQRRPPPRGTISSMPPRMHPLRMFLDLILRLVLPRARLLRWRLARLLPQQELLLGLTLPLRRLRQARVRMLRPLQVVRLLPVRKEVLLRPQQLKEVVLSPHR